MGIHFRLGTDEPGFIIGGFIADCYTGGGGAAANASSVTFTADAGGRPRTCRSPDALSLSFVATTNNGRRQYHVSYDVAPESDDITAVAVAGADVINTAAVT